MIRSFLSSSVGKKYVMGLTGLVWVGFVLVHMLGNLLIFVSPEAYNSYGHAITSGKITPIAEVVLVLSFVAHVFCAISLTIANRKARGDVRYAKTPNGAKAGFKPAQFMAVHGSVILVFIISHLATFKYGPHYETTVDGVVMRDLYRLLLEVFKQPGYVGWYLVSLFLLGFHLSHGVSSVFQSLGLRTDYYAPTIKKVSILYGLLVAAGFLSQPIYVFFFAGQG